MRRSNTWPRSVRAAPSPLVDEATPLGVHLVLWGGAGLLMAFVMALITWQGARRLAGAVRAVPAAAA